MMGGEDFANDITKLSSASLMWGTEITEESKNRLACVKYPEEYQRPREFSI